MPPAVFEPAIPAGGRLQTHALDHSATGIGIKNWFPTILSTEFIFQFLDVITAYVSAFKQRDQQITFEQNGRSVKLNTIP